VRALAKLDSMPARSVEHVGAEDAKRSGVFRTQSDYEQVLTVRRHFRIPRRLVPLASTRRKAPRRARAETAGRIENGADEIDSA
jgi:hypothetical protein